MKYNNDIWSMFDQLFADFPSAFSAGNEIYHASSFPPVNVFIDEGHKDLTFEFALAGYQKDDVSISFEGDKMILSLKTEAKDEGRRCLKKGFKTPNLEASYVIPSVKYKTDDATAEMKDGVLIVNIPAVDSIKPKQLLIS